MQTLNGMASICLIGGILPNVDVAGLLHIIVR